MNITGSVTITTDINVLRNCLGTHRIVAIGEVDDMFIQNYNAVVGSILLPPYKAMMYFSEGNLQMFSAEYFNHLMCHECMKFTSVLVKAMMNGSNLLLYMTPDEYNIYYSILRDFISQTYGIVIGDLLTGVQCGFNPSYTSVICTILYLNELIDIKELLMLYPQGEGFDNNVISKLIVEMNPYLPNPTFEEYAKYFYEYKEKIKNGATYTQNIFRKVL